LRLFPHLAGRFFGALSPRGPSSADEAWVASTLGAGELRLWSRMSGPDRRHAVGVARRVGGAAPREVLAAALLHDVGKIDSGLGTLARVPATLAGLVARDSLADGNGRLARYLRHSTIGATLLTDAGAHPLTIAWAAEHHLPPARWTIPVVWAEALKAADDD
jgi:hypothetical protein